MLHNVKTLNGYKLDSLDGEMGKVKNFYFDDKHWTVRYLVADTGNWLKGRQVLISPHALVAAIKEDEHIAVDLTEAQIEESPPISADIPVSRQHEIAYYQHYGWTPYWGGPYSWGIYPNPFPAPVTNSGQAAPLTEEEQKEWDPHLRSTQEITGYHIQAIDDEIGHVEDFIIDDDTWAIRYMVVDTKNWWPGKKVLISPQWLEKVSWDESKMFVNLTRDAVKEAPEYTGDPGFTREFEADLHAHHGREGYWNSEELAKEQAKPNQ